MSPYELTNRLSKLSTHGQIVSSYSSYSPSAPECFEANHRDLFISKWDKLKKKKKSKHKVTITPNNSLLLNTLSVSASTVS